MPAPKGHPRWGGRQPGTKSRAVLSKEAAREALRTIVLREMDSLVAGQLAQAKGLRYLVAREKKTGKFVRVGQAMARRKQGQAEETIEVWEKDPSIQAFTDLMNRALDKPAEQEQRLQISLDPTLMDRLDTWKREQAAKKQTPP